MEIPNKKIRKKVISTLNEAAIPFYLEQNNFDQVLELIGDCRFVLLGESTHGSEEFYQARIAITQQLILKKGFQAIAIEGDWPDAYRVNTYLSGNTEYTATLEALAGFKRFPTWMWHNTTLPPFLKWLRDHNDQFGYRTHKIGFYGLDLYSLHTSMQKVIAYLEKRDLSAAKQARFRYACLFDKFANFDPQNYGYLVSTGIKTACTRQVIEQLLELQHHAFEYIQHDGINAEEEYFYAAQNARLVKNAEAYYRAMFSDYASSWNIRDQHMAETLEVLATYLEDRFNTPAKIIIWAHNSHVGDARATEMLHRGEINVGQLIRERYQRASFLLGFSTYSGTVTAASEWDGPAEIKQIVPALPGSYEALFHDLDYQNFLLPLFNNSNIEEVLLPARLQRAIGVIYHPETERLSHYYFSHLPHQFNAIIHLDKTTAVTPLDYNETQHEKEIPETFPFGV